MIKNLKVKRKLYNWVGKIKPLKLGNFRPLLTVKKHMYENVTFPIGNIVLLDRIEKDYGYFDFMFGKIGGKATDFQEIVKSLMYNKLTENVSINQIPNIYSDEAFEYLGLDETPAERTFYRTVERLGDKFEILYPLQKEWCY